jgi:hypothetical protein
MPQCWLCVRQVPDRRSARPLHLTMQFGFSGAVSGVVQSLPVKVSHPEVSVERHRWHALLSLERKAYSACPPIPQPTPNAPANQRQQSGARSIVCLMVDISFLKSAMKALAGRGTLPVPGRQEFTFMPVHIMLAPELRRNGSRAARPARRVPGRNRWCMDILIMPGPCRRVRRRSRVPSKTVSVSEQACLKTRRSADDDAHPPDSEVKQTRSKTLKRQKILCVTGESRA